MSEEEKKDDLTYAATDTCPCGAKLAYAPGDDCWDCSDILLKKAIPEGKEGAVKHTGRLPFRFWKIKVAKTKGNKTSVDKMKVRGRLIAGMCPECFDDENDNCESTDCILVKIANELTAAKE